ncbi:hypothetical protein HYH02_001122 [Chlamydomonas schloesseri]|uniref:Uncharacterized protein n=1 Tax=Chlamydomonas schloesseri TaxID=2026947 RepID=A0A835WVB5_9CHLO|nr:hypothetical protein HYH02_001122 [Chlamydomonas schloesseri]|eukprot:KAG2454082.1 hypothetical protein HYH02_001122 [Chlamydomonas schloesseri]
MASAASGEPGPSSEFSTHVAVGDTSQPPSAAPSAALVSHLAALVMGLRDHAAALTQHLQLTPASSSSAPTPAAAHAMGAAAEGAAGPGGFAFGFHLPAPQGGWGGGLRLPGSTPPHDPSMRHLPLGPPPAVPPSLSPRSTGHPHTRHQPGPRGHDPLLPPEEEQWDDEHLWAPSPAALFLPWSYGDAPHHGEHAPPAVTTSASSGAPAADGGALSRASPAAFPSAAAPLVLPFSLLLPPRLASLHAALGAHVAGLALAMNAAASLQQRLADGATARLGAAAAAADRARRRLPPPADLPSLVHHSAASAAAAAEESLAFALSRAAASASAAAAGLPAAAAAVTGSAAAAAAAGAVTAPHLHMLRSSRRRLRAAVVPLLDILRGLRRGCTTHVLLRFILHSALQPGLRRQLLMRLDVAAQRAAQVALLQEQHEAWAAQQPALLHGTSHMDGRDLGGRGLGTHSHHRPRTGVRHPLAPTSAGPGGRPTSAPGGAIAGRISSSSGSGALPEPLSARWYRTVFAAEMRACVRQLELGSTSCGDGVGAGPAPVAVSGAAPSSFSPASISTSSSSSSTAASAAAGDAAAKKQPPAPFEGYTDDATAAVGAPPGAFDLRDLYRLIRVLEVAAEDLAAYD